MKPLRSWLSKWIWSRLGNAQQYISWPVWWDRLSQGNLLWFLLLFIQLHIVMLDDLVTFCICWSESRRDQVVRPAELRLIRQYPFEIAYETLGVSMCVNRQPSFAALEVAFLVCHVFIGREGLAINSETSLKP